MATLACSCSGIPEQLQRIACGHRKFSARNQCTYWAGGDQWPCEGALLIRHPSFSPYLPLPEPATSSCACLSSPLHGIFLAVCPAQLPALIVVHVLHLAFQHRLATPLLTTMACLPMIHFTATTPIPIPIPIHTLMLACPWPPPIALSPTACCGGLLKQLNPPPPPTPIHTLIHLPVAVAGDAASVEVEVPGPWPYPLVGHLPQFFAEDMTFCINRTHKIGHRPVVKVL